MPEFQERIPLFRVNMSSRAPEEAGKTLASGYVGQGPMVDRFESALRDELQLPHAPVTTNCCTSALDLAYQLIGIEPGDTVIASPVTCLATVAPLARRKVNILWADVNREGLISVPHVEELLESYPGNEAKAIVATDWGGKKCDFIGLRKFGVPVVEDAAHAYLAKDADKDGELFDRPGNRGDFICWSFGAIKHLCCGDGGALFCGEEHVDRARRLRWYGFDRTKSASFRCGQVVTEMGTKLHMNDIAASIGMANLFNARLAVEICRRNAEWLHSNLAIPASLRPAPNDGSSWWIYTLIVKDQAGFIAHMNEYGIDTSPVHARCDKHVPIRGEPRVGTNRLPGVEQFCSHEVAIPCGWWIEKPQLDRIKEAVESWSAQNS